MFATHQPIIGAWARKSPDNFARVCQFVVLTIRQSLNEVKPAFDDIEFGEDPEAARGRLFGFKARAWAEAWQYRQANLAFLEHIENDPDASPRQKDLAMLEFVCGLYGFGPVKAGFLLQLVFGRVGCLDTHNLNRFRIKPSAVKSSLFARLKTPAARKRFLTRYLDLCEEFGGCEKLWDSWCEYVANDQPKAYDNAFAVSAEHVNALAAFMEV
jgi:hypothetical protein